MKKKYIYFPLTFLLFRWLLLRNTAGIGIIPNGSQFHVVNNVTGQEINPNEEIQQTFDLESPTDNYFSNFIQSVIAVYFWINGRWDQLDQWQFWPVTLLSIVASVLLVILMQNMLIAFMAGAFEEAKSDGRLAVLKYRAELIAEYETLDKLFRDSKENPRHIFYIGNTNKISKWLRKCDEYLTMRKDSNREKFHEYQYHDSGDDDDLSKGDEGEEEWDITGLDADSYEKKNITLMKRKSRIEFYSSWSTSTTSSDQKDESPSESTKRDNVKDKKVLFEDDVTRSPTGGVSPVPTPMIEDINNIHSEIVTLKDSMKSIEGSIDDRLNLLEGKLVEMMDLLKLATRNLNSGNTGTGNTGI